MNRRARPEFPEKSDLAEESRDASKSESGVEVTAALQGRIRELEDALAARDEFIATVAHELRNPLSPIFFQLQLMLDQARQRPDGEWAVARLEKFSGKLNDFLHTLDRLLDLSRIAAKGVHLEVAPLDFAAVLHEVCAQLDRPLELARSTLRVLAPEPVLGLFDRVRLEQVCNNLLSNAIRYGAGGAITASLSTEGDLACLTVTDQGVGIALEDQARIFDRFERVTSGRTAGFGVGLWVVKQLCVAMGGTIRVTSAPGEGASFEVKLPRRLSPT